MKGQRFDFWEWWARHLPAKVIYYAALYLLGARHDAERGWIVDTDIWQRQFNYWYEKAFHERFMYWHSQNLSEGKKLSPLWKHGRGWLHLNGRVVFSMEWNPGNRHFCMVHLDWGGGDTDRDLSFAFGFPFVGFYHFRLDGLLPNWAVDGKMIESMARPGTKFKLPIRRTNGFSVIEGTLFIYIWHDGMDSSNNWRWNDWITFNPADFVLGRQNHSRVDLETVQAVVRLPEGAYPVQVTMFESSWKRARWPWPRKLIRAEIDCGDQGIPAHAGKGENSWDLDDDITYSMTCPAGTVEEAVRMLEESILRDRKRHGSPLDWLKQRGMVV